VRAPTKEQREVFCSRIILLAAEGRSTPAGQIEQRDAVVDGNNDAVGAVTRTEFGRTKIGSPSSGSGRGNSAPRSERSRLAR